MPEINATITFGSFPVYLPEVLEAACRAAGEPTDWVGKANSWRNITLGLIVEKFFRTDIVFSLNFILLFTFFCCTALLSVYLIIFRGFCQVVF